ncbi:MAG TPA: hypothetical protein VKB34_21145 [Povalibacter sp.]|nr:hypothetical protein [Povalibacter sp.]
MRADDTLSRDFDLYLLGSQQFILIMPLIIFGLFPIVMVVLIYSGSFPHPPAADAKPPYFPWFPFGLFWVFAALHAWWVATLPRRITLTRDQRLELRSWLKVRTVNVSRILRIEPTRGRFGLTGGIYRMLCEDGKIHFIGQFNDQHVLLSQLRSMNGRLELRGC